MAEILKREEKKQKQSSAHPWHPFSQLHFVASPSKQLCMTLKSAYLDVFYKQILN